MIVPLVAALYGCAAPVADVAGGPPLVFEASDSQPLLGLAFHLMHTTDASIGYEEVPSARQARPVRVDVEYEPGDTAATVLRRAVAQYEAQDAPFDFDVVEDALGARVTVVGRRDATGAWEPALPLLDHRIALPDGTYAVGEVWASVLDGLRASSGACVDVLQSVLPTDREVTVAGAADGSRTARQILADATTQARDQLAADFGRGARFRWKWEVRYSDEDGCYFVVFDLENLP